MGLMLPIGGYSQINHWAFSLAEAILEFHPYLSPPRPLIVQPERRQEHREGDQAKFLLTPDHETERVFLAITK